METINLVSSDDEGSFLARGESTPKEFAQVGPKPSLAITMIESSEDDDENTPVIDLRSPGLAAYPGKDGPRLTPTPRSPLKMIHGRGPGAIPTYPRGEPAVPGGENSLVSLIGPSDDEELPPLHVAIQAAASRALSRSDTEPPQSRSRNPMAATIFHADPVENQSLDSSHPSPTKRPHHDTHVAAAKDGCGDSLPPQRKRLRRSLSCNDMPTLVESQNLGILSKPKSKTQREKEAAAERAAARRANRIPSKDEALQELSAIVSTELSAEMLGMLPIPFKKEFSPIQSLVRLMRKTSRRKKNTSDIWEACQEFEEECEWRLHLLNQKDFAELDIGVFRSRDIIVLGLYGSGGGRRLDTDKMVDLEKKGVRTLQGRTTKEMRGVLKSLLRSIAWRPYKSGIPLNLPAKPKTGWSHPDTYVKSLQCIKGVTGSSAGDIMDTYPTLSRLMDALARDGATALHTVSWNRSGRRPTNPVIQRLTTLFTSKDPSEVIR